MARRPLERRFDKPSMVTRLLLMLVLATGDAMAAPPAPVVTLDIKGAIGPATADYYRRGLASAAKDGAQLVVLTLDTPGGLETSMRQMVQATLASPVPVATFVAPAGARAASAGTFLLYASHIAAMAPGTNVGAASPVSIGIGGTGSEPRGEDGAKSADKGPRDVHERKAFSDAAAFIRGLAQLRGRNAEWAEKAVLEASSVSASEALSMQVVDLVAADLPDLLRQLDGRKVEMPGGVRELSTANVSVVATAPDWHDRLLSVITDPTIALILMMIGIYGLIFELGSPGLVFPGVAGAVCLLLALYALHLLPVNYAGVALIVVGVGFIIAELFVPTYGSLGIGGALALGAGALMLIDTGGEGFAIPWSLVAVVVVATVAFVAVVVRMAVKARGAPVVSGVASLVGADGEMVDVAGETGWATIRGETWKVTTAGPVVRGQRVRVVAMDGITPRVSPIEGG